MMFFCFNGWKELTAMNALQDHGIISDNCVWWKDVQNKEEAVEWLKTHKPEAQEK